MKIFKNKELTETVANQDTGNFTLDLGTTLAGDTKVCEFYIHNDKDCDLVNINIALKPVIEIKEGIKRDYTQCLQEVTISSFPKMLKHNESHKLQIKYEPRVEFFRSLKFNMEITASEIPL